MIFEKRPSKKMQGQGTSRSSRCFLGGLPMMLCFLFLISLLTIVILSSTVVYPRFIFTTDVTNNSDNPIVLPQSIYNQVSNLQMQLVMLLREIHNNDSEVKTLTQFSERVLRIVVSLDKLENTLSSMRRDGSNSNGVSQVEEDSGEPGESEDEDDLTGLTVFNSGELRKYMSPKPNRQARKKIFLGVEAIAPSIGLACRHVSSQLDRFMAYKVHGTCPDDWDLAQKLIASGCDPLPMRRCLSRTPPEYSNPLPISSSLWIQPNDSNILWSHYRCKSYTCLVSNETMDRKGFFKCADCFNFSTSGWITPTNESASAEYTIDEVLGLKTGEMRVGLDFSPTTGTFAALMREKNVTIASATLNLGAPFNEVIALRGLLSLYLSVGSRLPFFDNTLDIIHTTKFLDGWISMELLQFVLFDWDRVLRPRGILWVDRFFCKKDDMQLYLQEFERLGYKKLLWRVVPKIDKAADERFFSAVLEKPVRK